MFREEPTEVCMQHTGRKSLMWGCSVCWGSGFDMHGNPCQFTAQHRRMPDNAELCVGGRIRLLKTIYDDGEDHHPPGWLAQAGEVLIVKAVRGDVLAVAHEGNPGAFVIYPGEYETHNLG